jgi:hypothetical protein
MDRVQIDAYRHGARCMRAICRLLSVQIRVYSLHSRSSRLSCSFSDERGGCSRGLIDVRANRGASRRDGVCNPVPTVSDFASGVTVGLWHLSKRFGRGVCPVRLGPCAYRNLDYDYDNDNDNDKDKDNG